MRNGTPHCPECQAPLSRRAVACPGCGVAGPWLRWWGGVAAIGVTAVLAFAASFIYVPARWQADSIVTPTGETAAATAPPRYEWAWKLEPLRSQIGTSQAMQGDRLHWPWLSAEHGAILAVAAALFAWLVAAHRRRFGR